MRDATGVVHTTTTLDDARNAVRLADLDPAAAMGVAQRAARRAGRAGDAQAQSMAERALGHALLHCGELADAIRHLRRAIASAHRCGSATLAGEAQTKLAHAMVQRGQPRSALTAIDAALTNLDGVARARATAQRAIILHLSGRLDEAAAEFDAALPVLRRHDDVLGIQRMLINRAFLHADRHAFWAAKTDLAEAERLARQLGRELTIGIIAANLGFFETLRGDVAAALAHFERAERITSAHQAQLGTIHQDRGELLLSVGLVCEARAAVTKAVDAYRREGRRLKVPEAQLLLAQAAHLERDWPAAIEHADTARRQFTRQRRTEWAELARLAAIRARLAAGGRVSPPAAVLDSMVNTLDAAGWPAAAVEARLVAASISALRQQPERGHLQRAGAARRAGPAALRARGWYAQALLRQRSGDAGGAAAAARRGLSILDEHNAAMGATDLRAHAAIHRAELAELGLRGALHGRRPAAVFEWAERGRASHLLHRPVRPPRDPVLADLLSRLRSVTAELDGHQGGRGAATLIHRQAGLERRIRDHSRLQRGAHGDPVSHGFGSHGLGTQGLGTQGPATHGAVTHSAGTHGAGTSPVRPAELAAGLAEWALVEFVQLDGVLHGLSLSGGRLRLRTVGPVSDIADLTHRLPFALHRLARREAPARTTAAALNLLYQTAARLDAMLLAPFADQLGDRPFVVVPTGPLHGVPWSVLPSCVGRPLTVAPSATLWHASRTRAREPGRSVVVAAGPKLRGAREEATAVAALHGTAALVDDAATVDTVLGALGTAQLVHLAAHGRLSAENPLFSHLLLADGPLVVYDLEQLPRTAHTVVLAACDSGRSVVRAGDELLGLSAAFMARGTAQLIASVVPVPDAETTPLMVTLHRGLLSGLGPAAALALAQQQLTGQTPAELAAAAGFLCLGAEV